MIDKDYCMSSYLAFRYIENPNCDFYQGMNHKLISPLDDSEKKYVTGPDEIDCALKTSLNNFREKKLGLLLSGGMDSAILASYMPNSNAYTFRFSNGEYQSDELKRAEYYAKYYNLNLKYVDISWEIVEKHLDILMKNKGAPVHSIEPQIMEAALQAKNDGVEMMVIGESSDLVFGGMDQLLSQDWLLNDFKKRYIFTNPDEVLVNPKDVSYLFERYRENSKIDFMKFMDDVFSIESSSSYQNAFDSSEMKYFDPYARLRMKDCLDLSRIRNGEPKYHIRALFHKKYPEIPIPDKLPMPRPVDEYFKNWSGPKRSEFRKDIQINKYTGNQKWQLYCLERFLNNNEPVCSP